MHDPPCWPVPSAKAAQRRASFGGALLTLSAGGVTRRVCQLLEATSFPSHRARLDALAAAMVLMVIGLGGALPSATLAAIDTAGRGDAVHHCPHQL